MSRLLNFQADRADLATSLLEPMNITRILFRTINEMKVELKTFNTVEQGQDLLREKMQGSSSPVVVWFDDRARKIQRLNRARVNYRFQPRLREDEWRAEKDLLFLLSQRICFALKWYNRSDQTDVQMCRTVMDVVTSALIHNQDGPAEERVGAEVAESMRVEVE